MNSGSWQSGSHLLSPKKKISVPTRDEWISAQVLSHQVKIACRILCGYKRHRKPQKPVKRQREFPHNDLRLICSLLIAACFIWLYLCLLLKIAQSKGIAVSAGSSLRVNLLYKKRILQMATLKTSNEVKAAVLKHIQTKSSQWDLASEFHVILLGM